LLVELLVGKVRASETSLFQRLSMAPPTGIEPYNLSKVIVKFLTISALFTGVLGFLSKIIVKF
jgi:hypothetical protein